MMTVAERQTLIIEGLFNPGMRARLLEQLETDVHMLAFAIASAGFFAYQSAPFQLPIKEAEARRWLHDCLGEWSSKFNALNAAVDALDPDSENKSLQQMLLKIAHQLKLMMIEMDGLHFELHGDLLEHTPPERLSRGDLSRLFQGGRR